MILKPCPFCGWKAEIETTTRPGGALYYMVHCSNEGNCPGMPCTYEHPSEAVSIAAWNRRAPSDREAKLVEALEDAERWLTATHGDMGRDFSPKSALGKTLKRIRSLVRG